MSTDDHANRWFEPALFQQLPPRSAESCSAQRRQDGSASTAQTVPRLPVNYVLYRDSIFFRTAADSAISRAMPDSRVAFEVDDIDEFLQRGWSVLAVGYADLVDDPDLLVELWGDRGPKPWAAGARTQLVRIRTSRLTGRRVLSR